MKSFLTHDNGGSNIFNLSETSESEIYVETFCFKESANDLLDSIHLVFEINDRQFYVYRLVCVDEKILNEVLVPIYENIVEEIFATYARNRFNLITMFNTACLNYLNDIDPTESEWEDELEKFFVDNGLMERIDEE